MVGFLKTSQEGLETCETDIRDLGRWIPQVTSEILEDTQDLVKTKQALCDVINWSGECTDCEGLCDTMAKFKKDLNVAKAAIDVQVKKARILKK